MEQAVGSALKKALGLTEVLQCQSVRGPSVTGDHGSTLHVADTKNLHSSVFLVGLQMSQLLEILSV